MNPFVTRRWMCAALAALACCPGATWAQDGPLLPGLDAPSPAGEETPALEPPTAPTIAPTFEPASGAPPGTILSLPAPPELPPTLPAAEQGAPATPEVRLLEPRAESDPSGFPDGLEESPPASHDAPRKKTQALQQSQDAMRHRWQQRYGSAGNKGEPSKQPPKQPGARQQPPQYWQPPQQPQQSQHLRQQQQRATSPPAPAASSVRPARPAAGATRQAGPAPSSRRATAATIAPQVKAPASRGVGSTQAPPQNQRPRRQAATPREIQPRPPWER